MLLLRGGECVTAVLLNLASTEKMLTRQAQRLRNLFVLLPSSRN